MPYPRRSLAERLAEKINFDGPVHHVLGTKCHIFTGHVSKRTGYGRISTGGHVGKGGEGKIIDAHRAAWIVNHGPLGPEDRVLHRCDVKACVRDDHLFKGTDRDNTQDMLAKGRGNFPGAPGEKNASAKLTDETVSEIRRLYSLGGVRQVDLALRFDVTQTTISGVVTGRRWKHLVNGRALV